MKKKLDRLEESLQEKWASEIVDSFLKKATNWLQRVVASKDLLGIRLASSLIEGAMKMWEDNYYF